MRFLLAITCLLALFAGRVRSAEPIDEKRLASLIRDLDASSFRVREKAEQDLKKLGGAIRQQLQRAAASSISPEQACRLNRLLVSFPADDPLRKKVREVIDLLEGNPSISLGLEGATHEQQMKLRQCLTEVVALGEPGLKMLEEEGKRLTNPRKQRELAAIIVYFRNLSRAVEK
jgi:hypothetical protein